MRGWHGDRGPEVAQGYDGKEESNEGGGEKEMKEDQEDRYDRCWR
jgi:hypothetical protein